MLRSQLAERSVHQVRYKQPEYTYTPYVAPVTETRHSTLDVSSYLPKSSVHIPSIYETTKYTPSIEQYTTYKSPLTTSHVVTTPSATHVPSFEFKAYKETTTHHELEKPTYSSTYVPQTYEYLSKPAEHTTTTISHDYTQYLPQSSRSTIPTIHTFGTTTPVVKPDAFHLQESHTKTTQFVPVVTTQQTEHEE